MEQGQSIVAAVIIARAESRTRAIHFDMERDLPIDISREQIATFCHRHGIARLSLYGSVLRDDFTPESDVDVLVEFLPDVRIGFFGFQLVEDELSAILRRKADLNTPRSLSAYF